MPDFSNQIKINSHGIIMFIIIIFFCSAILLMNVESELFVARAALDAVFF